MLTISDLFHLDDTIAASLFAGKTYPWEVLEGLSAYILQLGATLSPEEFDHPAEDVWIAKDAKVFPSAYLGGPCIIDHGAEIRHGAFMMGSRFPTTITLGTLFWAVTHTWEPVPLPPMSKAIKPWW